MGVRLNYAANYSGLFTIESNHFQSRISDIFTQMRFHEKLPKLFYFIITSILFYVIAKKKVLTPMCLLHGSTSLHSCVPPATTKSSLTNLACDQQKVQVIGCGQKLGKTLQ